jgi:hypothetical protein
MKRRWVIVAITSMALIGAGIFVRTNHKNRQLAKQAAAYRIRAERRLRLHSCLHLTRPLMGRR